MRQFEASHHRWKISRTFPGSVISIMAVAPEVEMSTEWSSDKLRVLPPDYPEQARERIRQAFGLTDAELTVEFSKLRQAYDDPRRTVSKRGLLKRIAKARAKRCTHNARYSARVRFVEPRPMGR